MNDKIYDFLIIGSGIAGQFFALEAAKKGSVLLISKDKLSFNNTYYAQGGIASVQRKNDSFDMHIKDTMEAGAGICKEEVVKFIIENGPLVINKLIEYGINFTRDETSENFSLHKEGGHSENRIFHYADITGQELMRGLIDNVRTNQNITIKENFVAIDILTEHQKKAPYNSKKKKIKAYGAYILNDQNEVEKIMARATILATGGAGQVYLHTSNPIVATGDGLAMAYRARASVANLEFFQFHPTTLYTPKIKDKSFLITEAVRGFGGVLRNIDGQEFMHNYHPLKSLAPRDIVAKAIDNEMKKSGSSFVYLDISNFPANKIIKSFPNIYKKCLEEGIDITKDYIPVVPAAHYQCGGILTDQLGKTDIEGLFATGEVACTGLHGANRLASNSLLEALVVSHFSAQEAANYITEVKDSEFLDINDWDHKNAILPQEKIIVTYLRNSIKNLMSDFVGIVRSNERLDFALKSINLINKQVRDYYKKVRISKEIIELRNLSDIACLVIRSSNHRKESRGLNYNIDYPKKSQKPKKFTVIKAKGNIISID